MEGYNVGIDTFVKEFGRKYGLPETRTESIRFVDEDGRVVAVREADPDRSKKEKPLTQVEIVKGSIKSISGGGSPSEEASRLLSRDKECDQTT